MSAVARNLEDDNRSRLRLMTPAERLAEALALGRAAVAMYAAANGIEPEEARGRLGRSAQAGRRSSRVMRELDA